MTMTHLVLSASFVFCFVAFNILIEVDNKKKVNVKFSNLKLTLSLQIIFVGEKIDTQVQSKFHSDRNSFE
jgi:hypothetical protein